MRAFRQILLLAFAVFVVLIFVEARFPSMDRVTAHEPHPMRAVVAGLAMRELGAGDNADGLDRILRLDPNEARAWERRCTSAFGPSAAQSLFDCRRAYELDSSAANLRNVASAEEFDGQPCEAESDFGQALIKPGLTVRKPLVLRDQARAALACGKPEASLQALQQAEQLDLAESTDVERDPTQVADPSAAVRESLASDRGYLSVVYERMNQADKARQSCTEANPGSPGCSCELAGSALICSQTTAYTIASR